MAAPHASIATPEPKAAGAPADVRGRVVGQDGVGIARLNVSLGDRTTLTGPEGEFVFDRAPKTYDIKITGRRSFRATVYLGLSRRDPVLAFTADTSRDRSTRHHAAVAGVVFPGDEESLSQLQLLLDQLGSHCDRR